MGVNWSEPRQLADLALFYAKEAANPLRFDDETFIANVEKAFWSTNCWSFVEQAFAIIAPACSRRPHLVRRLIRHPIEAAIAGGLEEPADMVFQGVACATKSRHYVEPTEEGKRWLIHELPKLDPLVREVFAGVLASLDLDEE